VTYLPVVLQEFRARSASAVWQNDRHGGAQVFVSQGIRLAELRTGRVLAVPMVQNRKFGV
jgi:hypothetical protein